MPVVGDAKEGLPALLPLLTRKSDRAPGQYQKDDGRLAGGDGGPGEPSAARSHPQYLMRVIDRLAADDAILTCDSGTIATWAARHLTIRGDREFYLSGNLATMAPGLPYAIGIQHAFPGRQVIAFVGDGGFAMLMAEFHTAVRYGLPVKVIINNNDSLGQILWEQMVLGYPEFGVRFPHRPPLRGLGHGLRWLRRQGRHGRQTSKPPSREALAFDGPALVDVDVNPDEPPMPGKVTYEQAKKFAEAFLRASPTRSTIATTLFKDKIEQLKR